mmetsp:Transcript_117941/g.334437  ORF Transcript_117941/g.334437 Transcript_117941/m.334437 type:complete len:234 (+) Transcript_117941:117-818(+)
MRQYQPVELALGLQLDPETVQKLFVTFAVQFVGHIHAGCGVGHLARAVRVLAILLALRWLRTHRHGVADRSPVRPHHGVALEGALRLGVLYSLALLHERVDGDVRRMLPWGDLCGRGLRRAGVVRDDGFRVIRENVRLPGLPGSAALLLHGALELREAHLSGGAVHRAEEPHSGRCQAHTMHLHQELGELLQRKLVAHHCRKQLVDRRRRIAPALVSAKDPVERTRISSLHAE